MNIYILVAYLFSGVMLFFGIPTIWLNIGEEGVFALNTIIGYVWFLFGLIPLYFVFVRQSFQWRVRKISKLLEKYQSPKGVSLKQLAEEMRTSEEKVINLVQDIIHFQYVNRIYIDFPQGKVVYLDSANVDQGARTSFTNVKCSCGGTTTVLKGATFACEYCGAKNQAQGISHKLIVTEGTKYTNAEKESLKENLRFGCGLPFMLMTLGFSFVASFLMIFHPGLPIFNIIGGTIFSTVPLGVLLFLYFRSVYRSFMAKYTRPLIAKYLSVIVSTRKVDGTSIEEIAKILHETREKAEKHIRFLLKRGYLPGVTIKGEPSKVYYLDDDTNFDRFVPVQCDNCNGEFVATYGKANRCPYCENGVDTSTKK